MPIRARVALFGAALVMAAMLGYGWLVYALASSTSPDPAGLRGFLIFSGVVILIVALVASWLAAGRALRPLVTTAQLMEDIALTRDLSRRLPTSQMHDEVGRLAASFNAMLQRLEHTHQQLAAALDAQRRLVADSSHELRTPLTSVRANAGLLLQRSDIAEEDRLAALRDIASETERMGRLVGDLLTLARADAGQALQLEDVDLAALVEEVGAQARRLYEKRTISVSATACSVRGDREALRQLLWILLDNAHKYTAEGGRIELHLEPQDNTWARLTVADDGLGLPESDLERIFERFYRVDVSRSGSGAGLGLSIARWIAQQHRGTIDARNRHGGGAVFAVLLPCSGGS